jgi:negative modulator of initiation of replication
MKKTVTIEITNELNTFLLGNVQKFGETASEVIERLLGLRSYPPEAESPNVSGTTLQESTPMALFLKTPRFRRLTAVLDRWVMIFAFAYETNPVTFKSVAATLKGRKRLYLSENRKLLEASGTSVTTREIPGSPYFICSNNSTATKAKILRDFLVEMSLMDYDIQRAVDSLS